MLFTGFGSSAEQKNKLAGLFQKYRAGNKFAVLPDLRKLHQRVLEQKSILFFEQGIMPVFYIFQFFAARLAVQLYQVRQVLGFGNFVIFLFGFFNAAFQVGGKTFLLIAVFVYQI